MQSGKAGEGGLADDKLANNDQLKRPFNNKLKSLLLYSRSGLCVQVGSRITL